MLCPRCGTNVGDSTKLCSACASIEPPVVSPRSTLDGKQTTRMTATLDEPAGFWLRFFASLIDSSILGIINSVVFGLIITGLFGWSLQVHLTTALEKLSARSTNPSSINELMSAGTLTQFMAPLFIAFSTTLIICLIYYPAFESSKLQATPGKLALGLLVTDLQTERLSFLRAFFREISKLLSTLSFGIGFLMAGFTYRKQALHDMVAGALVLKNPRVSSTQRLFAAAGAIVIALTWNYLSHDSSHRRQGFPVSVTTQGQSGNDFSN